MARYPACMAVLVALSAFASSLRAQAGPSERAASFFEALTAHRWRDAAALIHAERRLSFREEQLALLVAWAEQREELQKLQSQGGSGGMVGFSSEGVLRPDQLAKHGDTPVPGFGEATTLAAVAALPPEEFMARFLEASALDLDSSFTPVGERIIRRIIGEVVESSDVAHVLYRLDSPVVMPEDRYDVELLRLRSQRGEWFVWPLHSNFDFASGTRLHLLDMLRDGRPPGAR